MLGPTTGLGLTAGLTPTIGLTLADGSDSVAMPYADMGTDCTLGLTLTIGLAAGLASGLTAGLTLGTDSDSPFIRYAELGDSVELGAAHGDGLGDGAGEQLGEALGVAIGVVIGLLYRISKSSHSFSSHGVSESGSMRTLL